MNQLEVLGAAVPRKKSGWWWLEPWNGLWPSRNSWESSGPKWRTPSFCRGVGWNMLKPPTRSCWIPSNHVPTNDGVALPRCSTTNCSQLAIVVWVGIWKRIHRSWENHRNVTGWIFQLRFMRPFWVNPIFGTIIHLLLSWLIMLNWIYHFWTPEDESWLTFF